MKSRRYAIALVFVAMSLSFTATLFAQDGVKVFLPIVRIDSGQGTLPIPTPGAIQSSECAGGCAQYPSSCELPIKGDISQNSGERIYHVSGQASYNVTDIDPNDGERWFCTEDEARAAGWQRSER